MDEKVSLALASLNIPVALNEYVGKADKYIMYKIFNERDSDFADNGNSAVLHYVTMSLWYRKPADRALVKTVKELMKEAGFIFDNSQDLAKDDDGYMGRGYDFIFKEFL